MNKKCFLAVQDGTFYPGVSFGAPPPRVTDLVNPGLRFKGAGEVVFNTSMSGYHEILSDPSYTGQIVAMTYPHMGNYGTLSDWSEAGVQGFAGTSLIHAAGFIVRRYSGEAEPSGRASLSAFLAENGIPGVCEIDTRALTLRIRDGGSPKGVIVAAAGDELSAAERDAVMRFLNRYPDMEGRNLIKGLGVLKPEVFGETNSSAHIALIDCGIKSNILRELLNRCAKVTVFPNSCGAGEILSVKPDAVLISNGPGDPAVLDVLVATVRELMETLPVFGICLGHQIIGLALGAKTFKMKFGHHGANHPVRDEFTKKVFVTSQNHGFSIDESVLPKYVQVWMRNANDGTIEGLKHARLPVMCVQFHPEAAPGPRDSLWIFDEFLRRIKS